MPIITEITVTASTGFNHPFESYANFKPSITLRATVGPGEDTGFAALQLQRLAHQFVGQEKARILREVESQQERDEAESAVRSAEKAVAELEGTLKDGADEAAFEARISALSDWERDESRRRLDYAKSFIDPARNTLAQAKARLAALG